MMGAALRVGALVAELAALGKCGRLILHADGTEGGDHLQIGIRGFLDKSPSQRWQPGDSDSNGGGQEGHRRSLHSVVCQNSDNEDVGNIHNVEGEQCHNGILQLPSNGNSVH
jgi:hypothetical protein